MSRGEYLSKAAVFVAVVLVVAGGVALAGALRSPATPDYGGEAPSQFLPKNALTTVSDETGTIPVSDGGSKTVLIDRSHGNAFASDEIDPFVSALVENGHTVEYLEELTGGARAFNESLRRADAFVVINPTKPFPKKQIDGLEAFLEGGGRVVVFGDPATIQSGLLGTRQVNPRTTALGSRFGVALGSGYLYTMRTAKRDTNFQNVYVTPASDGPLTEGVNRAVMWKAAPVSTSDNATVLLSSPQGTHLSSTRRTGAYAVLARSGNLTVVGDTSILSSSSVYDASNEVLVGNLIEFLVTGEKAPCTPPKGGGSSLRPPGFGTPTPEEGSGATSAC